MNHALKFISLTLVAALAIAGCGGRGGSAPPVDVVTPPPVVVVPPPVADVAPSSGTLLTSSHGSAYGRSRCTTSPVLQGPSAGEQQSRPVVAVRVGVTTKHKVPFLLPINSHNLTGNNNAYGIYYRHH